MSLSIIILAGIILSIGFHFVGVYAGAKKMVWFVIVLIWVTLISIAMDEVKPGAYDEVKKMQGEFADTDKLIEDIGDKMSLYEFLVIKKSYIENKPKKR